MAKRQGILYSLNVILIFLIGVMGVVFISLYIETLNFGKISQYKIVIQLSVFCICFAMTLLTMILYLLGFDFVYKLAYLIIISILLASISLYFLKTKGVLDKIDSVADIRSYISSFGSYAVLAFILIQFLQVVALPIPGVLTIGAGVLLFGPFWGAVYSLIGILTGSFVAFFIGRVLGYKVASWLVGKKNLESAMKKVEGKDKVILTFMFLFPFFPDDVLCFVAGLSSMGVKYFCIMIIITRIISVITSSYSINGSIIPYNTWWGIAIWGVLILVVAFVSYFVYTYGDILEKYFKKRFHKKK